MPSLRVSIIAVGRLTERYWTDAANEYLKRLERYAQVSVTEVNDQGARTDSESRLALKSEASLLRQRIEKDAYTIMCDIRGQQLTSEGLAALLEGLQTTGVSRIDLVIGGSWGLDGGLKEEADMLLSLGPLTLPHNLARVVVLEQLYRSFRIIKGEPYHK